MVRPVIWIAPATLPISANSRRLMKPTLKEILLLRRQTCDAYNQLALWFFIDLLEIPKESSDIVDLVGKSCFFEM